MKVRTGFVSNSSSASFIVTIKKETNQLYGFLTNAVSQHLSFFELKYYLEEHKKKFEKHEKERLIEKESGQDVISFPGWQTTIDQISNQLEDLTILNNEIREEKDSSKREAIKIRYLKEACSAKRMYMNPLFNEPDNDTWTFTSHTTIYNDMNDIPYVMRDLVSACVFSGVKVSCKIEED